jgi:hypothetical protein
LNNFAASQIACIRGGLDLGRIELLASDRVGCGA